jgi:YrbI family 3-deoxy-D-manno-octulosonate 8-phosphate phosphatase
MKWVALMPLRAGSKSIPDKNVRPLAGRPLFAWSLGEAMRSGVFDAIYVASDSAQIRGIVAGEFPSGVEVIDRSAESASDTASTESVMLEFQERVNFDVLCLIQATSPLTRAEDFITARAKFETESLDSLLTAVRTDRFIWSADAEPLNYTPRSRPRRQDFGGAYVENGAFYFTAASVLERERCRLGGRIGIHVMPADTEVEIDHAADWPRVENALLARLRDETATEVLRRVKIFVLDVDGTLTDGSMYYGPGGEAFKQFHTHDGKGLERLRDIGVRVCVMTGEDSPATAARVEKLGITDYFPGVKDKLSLLEEQARAWSATLDEVAFIGDDLGDLECLAAVGASFCPADALAPIRSAVAHICSRPGGGGAVREACDRIYAAKTRQ